jgi:hypothetical protein
LASNLRRSKRTIGRRISYIESKLNVTRRANIPKRLGPGTVTSGTIAPGAVTTPLEVTEAIETAQSTADGKNKIYRQTTQPPGTAYSEGDLWFDTGNDNRFSRWSVPPGGGPLQWVLFTLGNNAIASIDATKITAGSLDAGVIVTSNLDAGKITAGILSSIEIRAGAPVGGLYPFRVETNGTIRATNANIAGTITANDGSIGAYQISGGSLTASAESGDFFTSITSTVTMNSNGTISSNYNYSSIFVSYYTTISLNGPDSEGGIKVEGTASGSYLYSEMRSSFIRAKTVFRDSESAYSDRRLKTNITDMDASYAKNVLKNVQPVKYNLIDDVDIDRYGFIAQDVYEIYPSVVFTGSEKDGLPWGIDYSKLSVILFPVLKEVLAESDILKEKVSELEDRISALESM